MWGFWNKCATLLGRADNEARGTPGGVTSHLAMRHWGIQDKSPMPDTGLIDGNGVYNRPLMRPAASPFRLNRRMDLVAPAQNTPWPSINWQPNFPQRVAQVARGGGSAPQHPGLVTVQQMQAYNRSIPSISSGLSGFNDAVSRALYGE